METNVHVDYFIKYKMGWHKNNNSRHKHRSRYTHECMSLAACDRSCGKSLLLFIITRLCTNVLHDCKTRLLVQRSLTVIIKKNEILECVLMYIGHT